MTAPTKAGAQSGIPPLSPTLAEQQQSRLIFFCNCNVSFWWSQHTWYYVKSHSTSHLAIQISYMLSDTLYVFSLVICSVWASHCTKSRTPDTPSDTSPFRGTNSIGYNRLSWIRTTNYTIKNVSVKLKTFICVGI